MSVIVKTGGLDGIRSLGDLSTAFALAGPTAWTGAAVVGFTALIAVANAYVQKQKEIDDNARNAFSTWSELNSNLETQISEITRLKTALDEGSLSEQEAYNAKSQLYDIQNQLVNSYGDQAQGIDLVNGKLEDQTNLIRKNIAAKEASDVLNLNENIKGNDRAIKQMEAVRDYELGDIRSYGFFGRDSAAENAIREIVGRYEGKIGLTPSEDGISETIYFNGNAEDAYDTISKFMTDVRNESKKFNDSKLFDSILNASSQSLSDAKGTLDTYKTTYEEAKRAQLIADTEMYGDKTAADWMYDAVNAVEEYNSALSSGDTSKIDEAGRAFYAIKSNIDNLLETSGMGQHSFLFNDIFDQVNKRIESQYKLEEELATGSAKTHAKILKASGLTALDLKQAFDTEDLQDGETQLNAIIDLADQLGYISKDSAEDVYRLIDSLAEWGYVAGGGISGAAKSVSAFQTSVKSAIETQNNLTAALAAGNSATGMTSEQMQNVISAFKDIKDFDMATLFENTATGIQMNTEAFKKYNKQIQLKEQAELLDAIIAKTEEYNNALNSDDKEKAFKELIQFQAMLDEYNASISKYNAYITATSNANARDNYGNVVAGYKSVGELIKQGWTTDDSVTSFMELVRGENWNIGTNWKGEEVILSTAEAYRKLSEKIKGTTHSLKDYLTTDAKGNLTSRGVWRFADDLVKIFGGDGSGIASKDENGLYELDLTGDNLQTVADRLGTTTEMVELFGKALSEAGMNVHFEPVANQIENLDKQIEQTKKDIEAAKEAGDDNGVLSGMEKLDSQTTKQIKLKVKAAIEGGQSITDLLNMDDKTLSKTLNIDMSEVEKARQQLEQLGKETGEIPLNVKLDNEQFSLILKGLGIEVEVTPVVEESPEVPPTTVDVTPVLKETPTVTPTTQNVTQTPPANVGSKVLQANGIVDYKLGSYPSTVPSASGIINYTGNFSGIGSPPTLKGTVQYTSNSSTVGNGKPKSTGTMLNVSHADGTAYNVLNYKRLSPSHAGGRVTLERNEYALTNEVGKLLANYKSI